jgi:hypothetical protein
MSDYSKSQEYRIKDFFIRHGIHAERVPLSGACAALGKGDVNVDHGRALVDHKSTIGALSISLKRKDMEKIRADAKDGLGILTFSFKGCRTLYAVITLEELITLLNKSWYNK